jgi:hypothetical protein
LWWRRLLGSPVAATVMLLHFLFKDTNPNVFFFVVFFPYLGSVLFSPLSLFFSFLLSLHLPPIFFFFSPVFFQFSHLSLFSFSVFLSLSNPPS